MSESHRGDNSQGAEALAKYSCDDDDRENVCSFWPAVCIIIKQFNLKHTKMKNIIKSGRLL